MKKILFIAAVLTVLHSPFSVLHSQGRFDAHVFAGLNMGQIDGDRSDGYSHPGLRAGVGTSFALGDDLASPWRMVVELAFTNKGSYNKSYNTTLSVNYIEVPILLSYNLLDNRLRLAAGVAPAVKIGSSFTDGGGSAIGGEDDFVAVDWLPLTVSARYRFTDHLGIEGRLQYSATSVTNDNVSGTYFLFRSNKGCFHNLVNIGLTYTF
ncbi:MAG: PorT family protein [Bacteroidales bacterium]|nr:PorT family protein [Bacteroidales bacterium]